MMKRNTFFGLIALWLGFWVVAPTMGNTTVSVPQLLLTEFPWIPAIIALLVVLWGLRRPRNNPAIALGIVGALLAIQPILQAPGTIAQIDRTMQTELGENYQSVIPEMMQARLAPAPFSIVTALGVRNFTTQAVITNDVEFFAAPERSLKLDIYEPQIEPAAGTTYPAIIVVHGGSWSYMDKSGIFAPHDRYLASQGYVVFDIQYRLTPEATYPAQLQDLHCAIAWVRSNADAYRVDSAQIALLGRSAGAHLTLLAAYRANDPSVDLTACNQQGVDTSVSAVVAIYPPTDLRLWLSSGDGAITALIGNIYPENPALFDAANPVNFVRDGLPPTLILQGYMDNLVIPAHAELLTNLLQATDTPIVLLRVPWARHGFDALMGGIGAQVTQYAMDRFLAWSFYR